MREQEGRTKERRKERGASEGVFVVVGVVTAHSWQRRIACWVQNTSGTGLCPRKHSVVQTGSMREVDFKDMVSDILRSIYLTSLNNADLPKVAERKGRIERSIATT